MKPSVSPGSSFTTIDFPGATLTTVTDINNLGQITGSYEDAAGEAHAFVRTGSSFVTFDVPGSEDTFASGINDGGTVVGCHYKPRSVICHAYVATVPEPGSLALTGTGVLLVLGCAVRRRPRLGA